jgi:hypothetical protein
MSSTLEQLNTYSSSTITYTDNRPEGLKFNYPSARDITKTITSGSFTIDKSIDIVEIINPVATNIVFEIDVSAVSGTTVQWASVPTGVSVVAGSVYKIYGIDSLSDWETMSTGTIVLPVTFYGSFFYTCTINYTQDGVRTSKSWQVGVYRPEAALESACSLTCDNNVIKGVNVDILATSSLFQYFYDAQLVNRFTLEVESIAYNYGDADLDVIATFDLIQPLSNLTGLTYQSNINNLLFDSIGTYVRDPNATSETFDVAFTVSSGVLSQDGGDTSSSSITISGTISQVNAILPTVIYYPDYDVKSTITLTWSIEKNSVLLDSGTQYITHTSEGTISTSTYTFTSSNSSFTIPYEEIEYGRWEYLIVGGGGGGAAGGGGAGGQVLKGTNTILSHAATHPITVGGGGSRGNYSFNYVTGGSWSRNAGQGGNSTAIGLTAYGGYGGRASANNSIESATVWEFDGGDTRKTDNTTQAGGAGAPIPVSIPSKNEQSYAIGAGGGGAGAGTAGGTAQLTGYYEGDTDIPIYAGGDGGNGVTSSITGVSLYYGGGGGGGGGYAGIDSPPGDQGQGGLGGGGNGSPNAGVLYQAENGTDGLGGGGGGGNNDYVLGPDTWKQPGRGGSGIVILKVTPR